jgi:hypothetical protein
MPGSRSGRFIPICALQYQLLKRRMYYDKVEDVETVEALLFLSVRLAWAAAGVIYTRMISTPIS